MANNSTGRYINTIKKATIKSVKDDDSPNAFFHLSTHPVSPWYLKRSKTNKYDELKATATIHVARMKKGLSLDLMSGERSGNTMAPNRSTAIRIRF